MFSLTPVRLRVFATLLVFLCLFPALGAAQGLSGMQCRLFDSRDSDNNGSPDPGGVPLASEAVETIQVTGNCGVPVGATAVIVNITAVEATRAGWLTVYPADMVDPVGPFNASDFPPGSLHFRAHNPGRNNTRALNAVVQLSPSGAIKVLPWVASGGTVHVIIDVFGYFGNGPAVANDDVATVAEDSTANAINVLANDSDPEGDAFSVSAVTSPTANGGTVAIAGGGTGVEYTPAANFCGTDTFTYTVSGGDTATVTVTVTCADDLADAVDDAATVAEDAAATAIDVLANDSDAEGDAFSVTAVTSPTANGGTVTITGGGTGVDYTPAAGYCGPDSFTYTITGGDTATVTITMTCDDDAPVAVADAATVAEDSTNNGIDVLANDTNADGGPMSVASVVSPTANGGTVAITGGGTGVSYTPAANFCGTDTFSYTLTPGSSSALVTVTVTCIDDTSDAVNDVATVAEDSSNNAIDVLANDTDSEGDTLSVTAVSSPTGNGGTVAITGGGTGVSYTPAANFCGTDTFTYTITGGDTATVTVTVTCADDAADAVDDAATVNEDSTNNAIDVLANDSDAEGDTLSVTAVSSPTGNGGTVAITGGGTGVSYTPAADFCGTDTFTYTVTGGDSATVTVTVTCVDDNPVAVADAVTVNEDSTNNAIDVLANDTDIDAGTKSVASVVSPTANGGTVAITGGGTGVTYTPAADFCGTDSFNYTLNGGSSATVTVTVTCVDDNPVAVADAATVVEDSSNNAIDVLANDTDPDGGTKSVASVVSPTTQGGTAAVAGGGTGVSYTPAANFCGTDSFNYTLNGGSSATVTVTVTCVDDNPVAVADAATVVEDSSNNAIDVLANDTDPDGGSKSVASVMSPTANGGTVAVAGGGTGVSYTPAANYCGADSFNYTLNGGSSAAVTVAVTCVDDAPVAVADAATVNEDTAGNLIDVLANDTDIDGGTKSVASVVSPTSQGGTAAVAGGGTGASYTPAANFCGTDSFNYTLNGGSSATVTVTVTCVDDNPTAVADAATVLEDSSNNAIDVLGNDTDPDGGAKAVTAVSSPTANGGTVSNGGSNVSYTPAANFCGTDSFTYTITGGSSTTVTVTVTCVDDNPVAVADAATVLEDSSNNAIDVLANDTDPDGGPKGVSLVGTASNGTAVVTGGGTGVSYTPTANYCGADSFSYTLNGGSSATVTVTVTCVDDPPTAVADAATVIEDSSNNAIDVLTNDMDSDGGPKSVASVGTPSNGAAAVAGGGTGVSYTPAANFCGTDSFTYTLNGGSSATVTVTVTCVNDAPVLADNNIDYTALGNTQLRVGETTPGTGLLHIRDNDDVDEKATPADVDGPGPITVVPFAGLSANGGNVNLNADGTFTYESAPGFSGTDSFTFTVTDNGAPAATTNGTVTIAVPQTVWYVHDVVDATHNPAASDTGRSTNAFETLSDVGPVLTDNDYVFIYRGNTGTTPHATGLRITRTGIKVHGEAGGFSVPGFTLVHTTPLSALRPVIANSTDLPAVEDHGIWVDATAASLTGIEIQHLDLSGRDNGIEVTATGANNAGVTISNNVVGSSATTGAEAIDVNANSTGTVTVAAINNPSILGRTNGFDARSTAGALRVDFSGNTIQSGATGVNIDGSGGGVVTVTGFSGNVVSGNNGGSGILVNAATFDQVAGAPVQAVSGGTTQVGQTGNGVNGSGMMLTNVQGALSFTRLDIVADNGSGLVASGTGTGFTISDISQLGAIRSAGGPAVNVSSSAMDLRFANVTVASSGSTGVALTNTSGTFQATAGSIASTTGTDFLVDGGNPTVTWPGTIANTAGRAVSLVNRTGNPVTFSGAITDTNGLGVELNNNTGTSSAAFTGGVTLSTAANPAFTATSGGTLQVTGSANTLTTTTGTALNVTNTTIHSSGLTFQSISAGTAASGPANGIVLNNTGTSGGLTVNGGTIQRTTGHGIALTTTRGVSLTGMTIQNTGRNGIDGTGVVNFSLVNGTISGSGTAAAGEYEESGIAFNDSVALTENNVSGTVTVTGTTITNPRRRAIHISNWSGTLDSLNLSNNTLTSSTLTTESLADAIMVLTQGSASTTAHISGATISNNIITNFPSGTGIFIGGGNTGSAVSSTLGIPGGSPITISGNRIAGASSANRMGSNAIAVTFNGCNGQSNFVITNNGTVANPLTNFAGLGISAFFGGNVNATATIDNNVLVSNNTAGSSGIAVQVDQGCAATDAGTATVTVNGNRVSNNEGNGIRGIVRAANGTLRMKVQNNIVSAPTLANRNGIRLDAGSATGDGTLCLNISGNTSAGSGVNKGIGLRKQGTDPAINTFGIHGMAATSSPGVEAYVDGLNPAGNGTDLVSATSGFSNCSLP